MVTSDFRPGSGNTAVLRMCNERYGRIAFQEIRVEEHDGGVRFLTGLEITASSRMRNENVKYNLFWPNCCNFHVF